MSPRLRAVTAGAATGDVRTDPHRTYLSSVPGLYLREGRWFAAHRRANARAGNWALEVLRDPVAAPNVLPVHPELNTHCEPVGHDRLADSETPRS